MRTMANNNSTQTQMFTYQTDRILIPTTTTTRLSKSPSSLPSGKEH